MRKSLFLPILIILLCLLPACRKDSGHDVLVRLNSQINHNNAERVLASLDSIDLNTLSADDRAWHAIVKALAKYESFIPLNNDSVLHEALMHFAGKGRRDAVVAVGYVMYGKGLINDSLIIEGMAAMHRAHDIALEAGDTLLAAKTAYELTEEYFNNFFLDESLQWAKKSRSLYNALGDTVNIGLLDCMEIDILQSMSRNEEVLSFYDRLHNSTYPHMNSEVQLLRLVKAQALSSLDRVGEALALLDSIPEEHIPPIAYFYAVRANILTKLGYLERAKADLSKIRELSNSITDVMAYNNCLAAYEAANGDFRSAYLHSDSAFIYSEISAREDANRHPGGYLVKYYSEQERIARQASVQSRTIAILTGCVALLLVIVLIFGTNWVIRRHRKNKAEQQQLLMTIAELRKQAEEYTRYENADSGDFQMGLSYLVKLCDTLSHASETVNGANAEAVNELEETIEYYRSDRFFASLAEDINKYYNGWAERFSADAPDLTPESYKLALLLFLRLTTETMSFLLNKSKSAISTQKNRLKEQLVREGDRGLKYFEALNISRNNL